MRLFVFLISLTYTTSALVLPDNLRRHLDTNSPHYTTTLSPWNYTVGYGKADISTLKFVIGVARHGNRPPSETYQGDKYPFDDPTYWPDGPKQLTSFGKNQLFQVGQRLRERYDGFLSPTYSPGEVEMWSNTVDRVKMSAETLLAGLFPPVEYQLWNEKILWQPIPVHDVAYDMSDVSMDSKICPKFYQELMESCDAVNAFNSNHQEMLSHLSFVTGKNVTNLSDVYIYWELFRLVDERGYKLPDWAWAYYPQYIANLQSTVMGALCASSSEMIKLLAGPQIETYSRLLKAAASSSGGLKMYLELSHETTLNGILPAFGFNEPFFVDTSALFLIELHTINESYFIELLYYANEKEILPQVLIMNTCARPCPFQVFSEIMDAVIPEDWSGACKMKSKQNC